MLLQLRVNSDSVEKMGDELTILLEAFHRIEKAGGQATLSLSTSSGKTKVKLEIPTTAAPPSASPSTSWHLGVATAAVVLEQGPAAICGLLPTRLPLVRRPPVFRWILLVLSCSIPLRHLLLGGGK